MTLYEVRRLAGALLAQQKAVTSHRTVKNLTSVPICVLLGVSVVKIGSGKEFTTEAPRSAETQRRIYWDPPQI